LWLTLLKLVFFGKYYRKKPLVFAGNLLMLFFGRYGLAGSGVRYQRIEGIGTVFSSESG
jgi:hypothetical protein